MNADQFKQTYSMPRNGCNHFVRHPLVRSFAYSDGVEALADMGCHWLLDILATELPEKFAQYREVDNRCIITVHVTGSKATIQGEFEDDVVAYSRHIDHTDMPEGEWKFLVADEDHAPPPSPRYRCILVSEY